MTDQLRISRRDALLAATTAAAATTLPKITSLAQTQPTPGAPKLATDIPPEITTPNQMETRAGTLRFFDGCPDDATIQKVYDNLDFTRALDAFLNTYQGASMAAIHNGFRGVGVKDNEILIFSELMDANSLVLTGNADTVYFVGFINLSNGPMVFEAPPKSLGTLDDFWWRWVIDFGFPGPDRGEGGKYLLLPPDYHGPLPEGGFFVAQPRTTRVLILGRSFLENNDPRPAVDLIKATAKLYPYEPGAVGTSIAEYLAGKATLARVTPPPAVVFHEGSGVVFNTVPPSDLHFYELLNQVVQQEPAAALDAELMGPLAAIGIVKGKPFAPDDRMNRIMTEAAALGNATARSVFMNPRELTEWAYYPRSSWFNPLFVSGYEFETPIPEITREGVRPYPPTGYRTLNARICVFYCIIGISPAMSMRLSGIGSQYLLATLDADKHYFDGAKTYKVILPKPIPAANFWSLTLYDNQTRSMLQTPQRYPRAGSQTYPSPAAGATADGSTTVYFAPIQPNGVELGNWIQTVPGKGFFVLLRLYGPLEQFFTKEWRPSEIEKAG
jgi:hypothetical protein